MPKQMTRHNDFFEKIMKDPVVARDFFKTYLPAPIRSALDFDSIRLDHCNTSIIRDSLHSREIADLLFQAKLNGAFIYLLFHGEDQSRPDNDSSRSM